MGILEPVSPRKACRGGVRSVETVKASISAEAETEVEGLEGVVRAGVRSTRWKYDQFALRNVQLWSICGRSLRFRFLESEVCVLGGSCAVSVSAGADEGWDIVGGSVGFEGGAVADACVFVLCGERMGAIARPLTKDVEARNWRVI